MAKISSLSPTAANNKKLSLTLQIFLALGIGIVIGTILSRGYPGSDLPDYFKPLSDLFLRLIKMVIAPLIFTTLVAGVAGAGPTRKVGSMGIRALLYFEAMTILALGLGLLAVNVVRPGEGMELPHGSVEVTANNQTFDQMLLHVVPVSVVAAMAEGDVLQIVVFSLFFALALGSLKDRAKPVITLFEIVSEAMFRLTNTVMHYAPIGIAAAIAYTIGRNGIEVLISLAWLVGTLYLTLVVFVVGVLLPIASFYRVPVHKFWHVIRQPVLIAFSTTSSEAALPNAMAGLERLGVPRRIVSFVMPLGYSFNLDGTTLYLSLAAVFIAQVAHVQLSLKQQLAMMFTLMLTSKGVAAVPRASAIILAGTLTTYGLPLQGLTMIFAVDTLMDMGRTTVNVIGNCLATVLVAKWEGEFKEASLESILLAESRDEV